MCLLEAWPGSKAGSYNHDNAMIKEERDYGNIRLENHNWSNAIITKARQDAYYKQYRAELLFIR